MAAVESKEELKEEDLYIPSVIDNHADWDKLLQEMKNGNVNYIKNLITSNDININAQNPENGQTLLIYAVIVGNFDLVKAIINFGANVKIKDNEGQDALQHAVIYGRYKITELVYYQELSGSLGKDLKHVATQIHDKDEESEYFFQKLDKETINKIIEFIMEAIKERRSFSPDLLYYCWYYITYNDEISDPLQSPLWEQMMETYQQIIENTSDKDGWSWLKEKFITSLIWYLPHPKGGYGADGVAVSMAEAKADDPDAIEATLKTTLFYEPCREYVKNPLINQ